MKGAKTIALSTFFFGILSACADQELKVAGLSCFVPDHWVKGEDSPETSKLLGKEYRSLSYFSSKSNEAKARFWKDKNGHLREVSRAPQRRDRPKAENKGRLKVRIGTKPAVAITAEKAKERLEDFYSDWKVMQRGYLGKNMVGGGVFTEEDLMPPFFGIVDHKGRKALMSQVVTLIPTPEGLVTFNLSATLEYIDRNGGRFLRISGPKELMELNKDEISKIIGSFEHQEEEQVGTVGFGTEKMFSLLFLAFAGAIALSVGITLHVRK
jgi:hypothetical protein